MHVDLIHEGIVLDHIKAGRGIEIYRCLGLEKENCSVAILTNVPSGKYGKKDIIKIAAPVELDYGVLAALDAEITVNRIVGEKVAEKKSLSLPDKVVGLMHCKNPRCITAVERQLESLFYLADCAEKIYRCRYCDSSYK